MSYTYAGNDNWKDNVYIIETTDPVQGGIDGVANLGVKNVADRTTFLKNLIDSIQSTVEDLEGMDVDFQNALSASIIEALSSAGLANREIEKTLNQRFQTGSVTIYNRGIKSGAVVSSGTGSRDLDFSGCVCFSGAVLNSVPAQSAFWDVPANNTGSNSSVDVYLVDEGDGFIPKVTSLGESCPTDSILIYRIDIPDGSDSGTDPDLTMCTFNDLRRLEPEYPAMVSSSVTEYVALPFDMLTDDYVINLEVESFVGSSFQLGYVYVGNKANNGFSIYINGAVDTIKVRWSAQNYSL